MQDETFLAIYKQLRQYLEHEDDLINARISRSMLLHGFLLAAYSLLVQAITDVMSRPLGIGESKCHGTGLSECLSLQLKALILISENLTTLISLLGIFAAFGTIIGVHAATSSIKQLSKNCNALFTENSQLVDKLKLPRISGGGRRWNWLRGSISTHFLPYTSFALWVGILVNTLTPTTVQSCISNCMPWLATKIGWLMGWVAG